MTSYAANKSLHVTEEVRHDHVMGQECIRKMLTPSCSSSPSFVDFRLEDALETRCRQKAAPEKVNENKYAESARAIVYSS